MVAKNQKIIRLLKKILYSCIFISILSGITSCNNIKENKAKPHILSFSELEKKEYTFPYILDYEKQDKHLLVYGCRHSFNPDDTMLIALENKFQILNPDLALNEGGNWEIYETRDETILKSGEQGFLRYLCNKNNVPVKSFEPESEKEYKHILSKYSKKDALLMYFCRQITQIQKQQEISNFQKYMIDFLGHLKQSGFPLKNTKKEFDDLIVNYEQLFNEKFDWKKFNPENVWPIYSNTILNEINKEITEFRDKHIVNLIDKELKNNNKIFVLMGGSHAVKQEPVIKYNFEK